MGGWTALLGAIKHPGKVIGVIGLAAAPDFTEELLWNKMTESEKDIMQKEGIYNFKGQGPECNHIYPISHNLILDGRKHLLLQGKQINIDCPVHLIHGMEDIDVPSTIATRIAEKLKTSKVVIKLIKDGNHKLSRPQDLKVITNSIDELLL
jgi:pimeloyl-ACP methyl ester carboxylesterase